MFATDKVSLGYLPTYLALAAEIGTNGRVAELGVEAGESLLMWQCLFPHGIVVGVDRSDACHWPRKTHRVVAEQDSDDLPELLKAISPAYDLIVDDASHDGRRTRRSWDLLFPLVSPGGLYVIEDWQVGFNDWVDFDESMLDAARSFVTEISRGGDVASVTYRFGMIVMRRRG